MVDLSVRTNHRTGDMYYNKSQRPELFGCVQTLSGAFTTKHLIDPQFMRRQICLWLGLGFLLCEAFVYVTEENSQPCLTYVKLVLFCLH